ncbi:hypothetical protein OAK81_01245 [Verrucomicrobiales bacterium]|nr:hypothetical protein [Verrucomicrobiales bacterium]MDC0291897.1 hypothetical protein [Verrucomicrobiales bacterium]MDC0322745.1 hypothetical protein [Verrucomicrobiales bacterium]
MIYDFRRAVIALVILWISSGWFEVFAGIDDLTNRGIIGFIIQAGSFSFQFVEPDDFGFHHEIVGVFIPYDLPSVPPPNLFDPFRIPERLYPTSWEVCRGSFATIREEFGFTITVSFWFLTSVSIFGGAVCWMVIRRR